MRKLLAHRRVHQTAGLYSSQIGLVILTFGTGILNSRFLGPTQYGFYTFVITIVEVLTLLGGLGFAPAGARMMALARSRSQEQGILGTLVMISLVVGLCISCLLAITSPLIDLVFHTNLKKTLLLGSILCVTAPLQVILTRACRGANRIGILATLNILPKGLYLLGGLGVVAFAQLTTKTALMLYFGGIVGACLFAVIALGIRFENVKGHLKEIQAEVRRYGFNVYLGGLADNSTYKLNNLLIAGYVDTTWLGFYSIASAMVAPMASFSDSLSASLYRSFTNTNRINKRVLLVNGVFLAASSLLIMLCARPLIAVVLTKKFLPATELVYILVFTAFFQGMYHPLSGFLAAHGKGREARNISFSVSLINLSVAAMLIPHLGAFGAAISSSIAKCFQFMGNLYYYRQVTRQLSAAPPHPQPQSELACP